MATLRASTEHYPFSFTAANKNDYSEIGRLNVKNQLARVFLMTPPELLRTVTPACIRSPDAEISELERVLADISALEKHPCALQRQLHRYAELIEYELAARRSEQSDFDIERWHREQLEHCQARIQLHEKAMGHNQRRHAESIAGSRRQFALALWGSWAGALVALLAMLAPWATVWYSHR
jgi:hypothetical protein